MDIRTDKVFAPDGRELTREEIAKLDQEPIKISGENCTNYCIHAFKRNCFTVDKKFRAKCTRFYPQRLDYHQPKKFV